MEFHALHMRRWEYSEGVRNVEHKIVRSKIARTCRAFSVEYEWVLRHELFWVTESNQEVAELLKLKRPKH